MIPKKFTAFNNKTSVDVRKKGLENYLNELFLMKEIDDSFSFRKFINFDIKYMHY